MSDKLLSQRKHISIFGETNAGKSTLFNKILGQDMTIVSNERGTTTDPVVKAMELIPYGAVALVDTAGLGDDTALGQKRDDKTRKMLMRTDFAIYAADYTEFDKMIYYNMVKSFDKLGIPHLLVFTKRDKIADISGVRSEFHNAMFVSENDVESINELKSRLCIELEKLGGEDDSILKGLVPAGSTVVMVIPIDSEAPRGRLILPQVQLIRDCLDNGIKCMVGTENELADILVELKKVDLVICDSQVFAKVDKLVDKGIMLTSFSLLLARHKGDLQTFFAGVEAIAGLKDGDKILIAEGCSHNKSHEDIGTVKIPNLLRKKTGKDFEFVYCAGHGFPENLDGYALVIHCGGCMLNKKEVMSRILICKDSGVPVTNYGVAIAYLVGILDRCKEIFI